MMTTSTIAHHRRGVARAPGSPRRGKAPRRGSVAAAESLADAASLGVRHAGPGGLPVAARRSTRSRTYGRWPGCRNERGISTVCWWVRRAVSCWLPTTVVRDPAGVPPDTEARLSDFDREPRWESSLDGDMRPFLSKVAKKWACAGSTARSSPPADSVHGPRDAIVAMVGRSSTN